MSYGAVWQWCVLGPRREAELEARLFTPLGLVRKDQDAGERAFRRKRSTSSFYSRVAREHRTIAFLRNHLLAADDIARVFTGLDGLFIQLEDSNSLNFMTAYRAGQPRWWVTFGDGALKHGGEVPGDVLRTIELAGHSANADADEEVDGLDGRVIVTIAQQQLDSDADTLDADTLDPDAQAYLSSQLFTY